MSVRAPALPFEVDGTMMTGGGDLAAVGQHTAEVLGALGMSAKEITAAKGKRPPAKASGARPSGDSSS